MALAIDWVLSQVESLVTPVSLQPELLKTRSTLTAKRRRQKWSVGVVVALLVFMFGQNVYANLVKDPNTIRIGSKQFTEQLVLGNMLGEMIEKNTNIKIESHLGAGGTQVLFSAMEKGDLDAYIDYTGTAYVDILKHDPISDEQEVYDTTKEELAKKYDVALLAAAPFSNTYTLAVDPAVAQAYNLHTMSDLSQVASSLKAGTTLEFLNRQDGLRGVQNEYGFTFKDAKGIDGATRYVALSSGDVQVVDAFSTDGLLKKYNLTVLADDKGFFPPYYGVPLVRQETIEEHPELQDVINRMMATLDTDTMRELNYQVDVEHKSPKEVAHDFLVAKGLVK